jgi:3-hydroxyisobutyrate dehydrogenase/2-hydroxy-3-oxopropionate reductase
VAAPYVGYKRAAFLDPDGTPTAFALELAEKDLRLITEFAAALDLAVPQAETNLAVMRRAEAALGPERDFSAVATYLRSTGGTT